MTAGCWMLRLLNRHALIMKTRLPAHRRLGAVSSRSVCLYFRCHLEHITPLITITITPVTSNSSLPSRHFDLLSLPTPPVTQNTSSCHLPRCLFPTSTLPCGDLAVDRERVTGATPFHRPHKPSPETIQGLSVRKGLYTYARINIELDLHSDSDNKTETLTSWELGVCSSARLVCCRIIRKGKRKSDKRPYPKTHAMPFIHRNPHQLVRHKATSWEPAKATAVPKS